MLSYFQTFTGTINRWLGKRDDFDGVYWAQCVDWARQYCQDSGFPISSFGWSAYNGWSTGCPFAGKSYTRIVKNTSNCPSAWDVVFFDRTPYNGNYGHVAIAGTNSTATSLDIIEQNAGTGKGSWTGADAVTRRTITYNDKFRGKCLGWFTRNI